MPDRIDPPPPTSRLNKTAGEPDRLGPRRQAGESRRQTSGFAQSRDGTFTIDFINKIITITDTQSPSQVRIKFGLLGAGDDNYGIEIFDQVGNKRLRLRSTFADADLDNLRLRIGITGTFMDIDRDSITFKSAAGVTDLLLSIGAGTSNIASGNSRNLVLTCPSGKEILLGSDTKHLGAKFGAYSATPVTKPTVTGSRVGNAALASLLTALANIGWIVDSST